METTFKITVPLEKSENEAGWFIKGLAAGIDVDSDSERLAPSAIQGFVHQINTEGVPFKDWHQKNTVTAEMGQVVKAWLEPDFRMGVEVELDQDHPIAALIWKKIQKGKQYGMSIGGRVREYRDEFDAKLNKAVRTFYDVVLDEISITTKPIWTPSLGTVLTKAVDETIAEEGDKTTVEVVAQPTEETVAETTTEAEKSADETTQEATTVESSAPENETTGQETEKAVTADSPRDARKLQKLVKMHQEIGELITELGIGTDAAPSTDSTTSETVAAEKSEDEPKDERLEKALVEISDLRTELNQLKESVPAIKTPDVIVSKSDMEELGELLKSMAPQDKLRLGLRAQFEGK